MSKVRANSVFRTLFCITVAVFCAFLLALPFPRKVKAEGEKYAFSWADGGVTEESYAQAYASFEGADEENIILSRGGVQGSLVTGGEYRRVYRTLKNGSLAELLSLQKDYVSRLEQAALWRTFCDTVWYSGESFVWNGNAVVRSGRETAATLVLLSGAFPKGFLRNSGADSLEVRGGAEISAADLIGCNVRTLTAEAPYTASGGALYVTTAGGKRLVAALPAVRELTIEADADFADEGALSPCLQIDSLTVPFIGSAKNAYGTAYTPFFGWLFGKNAEGVYEVPDSLKRVVITGGEVQSHAFYGCVSIEEIDAAGAKSVSKDAFSDCVALRYLRTAFPVSLSGEFREEREGEFTVYVRT